MKKILLAFSIPYLLSAQTIPELFDALKHHSQTKVDEMAVKRAQVGASQVTSQLYPSVNLVASYDNYSDPTNMLPLAPERIKPMLSDPDGIAQPYSYNIYKAGANFTMPIFVKSIYSMVDKAEALQKSARANKKINLIKNEALIVGSNANLLYLNALKKSLNLKEKSLQETLKTVKIKVNNGRLAESALYKIEDSLNQVSIAKNSIDLESKKLISSIEAVSGVRLKSPIEMKQTQPIEKNDFASLRPMQEKIKASEFGVKAEKEKLYPSVVAHGSYMFSTATSYNNSKNINEAYGDVGVVINIPLLAVSQYDSLKKSKIELDANRIALQKLQDELQAKADMLNASLPLLDNSIKLTYKSIQNKQKLLRIAKVNYKNGRLSTEEYLRYEDEVVSAKAKYYQAKAQKWQTLMELAVIYADNIEEIVQ